MPVHHCSCDLRCKLDRQEYASPPRIGTSGALHQSVVTGAKVVGVGFERGREMQCIDRLEASRSQRSSPQLDLIACWLKDGCSLQDALGVLTTNRIGVVPQLEMQHLGSDDLESAGLADSQDAQDGLSLEGHPDLVTGIKGPLNAAHVEVHLHRSSLSFASAASNQHARAELQFSARPLGNSCSATRPITL